VVLYGIYAALDLSGGDVSQDGLACTPEGGAAVTQNDVGAARRQGELLSVRASQPAG